MLAVLLVCACAEPAPNQPAAKSGQDGASADAQAADVVGSEALVAEDEPALRLLVKARAASEAASLATWPTSAEAIWPGFALHKVPTALVILNVKGMARRAYLFGFDGPLVGAESVVLSGVTEPIWRYDDATAEMGPGETVIAERQVADTSVLVVTWSANRDTDDTVWIELLGRGYMKRLRDMEAGWTGVQACGQTVYPRFEEAIALFLVECAVLAEALVFGEKVGIAGDVLLEVLRNGSTYSSAMDIKGDKMLDRSYEPQGRLAQHLKDIDLALDLGRNSGAPIILTALHAQLLRSAVAQGFGGDDNSAIIEVMRGLSGLD